MLKEEHVAQARETLAIDGDTVLELGIFVNVTVCSLPLVLMATMQILCWFL